MSGDGPQNRLCKTNVICFLPSFNTKYYQMKQENTSLTHSQGKIIIDFKVMKLSLSLFSVVQYAPREKHFILIL